MRTYIYEPYLITTKTNLHVGAGDNNFGIVDNLVQRDTITKLPVINSSSLKGALREYFKDLKQKIENCTHPNSDKDERSFINFIFGGNSNDEQKDDDNSSTQSTAGVLQFLGAFMIAMPIRGKDKPYYLVTSPTIISWLNEIKQDFNLDIELPPNIDTSSKIILEDMELSYKKIDSGILKDTILIDDKDFFELIETLPFIPRNHLDNGVSKNLFYEEIVPRESKFLFCIGKPCKELVDFKKYDKYIDCFDNYLNNNIVQIGANASIGYGLCKVEKLSTKEIGECDEQTDK